MTQDIPDSETRGYVTNARQGHRLDCVKINRQIRRRHKIQQISTGQDAFQHVAGLGLGSGADAHRHGITATGQLDAACPTLTRGTPYVISYRDIPA